MHLFAIASTKLHLMPFDVQLVKSCFYTLQASIHAPYRQLITTRSQRRKAMHGKYFARNLESLANMQACKPGSKMAWNHGAWWHGGLAMCKVCRLTGKAFLEPCPF